jgi:hypothetical protein
VLSGLSDRLYATDTAFVEGGGALAARADLRVATTFSNGRASFGSESNSRFDVYSATVELRLPVTRSWGVITDYTFYHHRYGNPADLPAGFPARYDRHAVRVGLTFWLPLLGATASQPSASR